MKQLLKSIPKTSVSASVFVALALLSTVPAHAEQKASAPSLRGPIQKSPPGDITPDELLKKALVLHALSRQAEREMDGSCADTWKRTEADAQAAANMRYLDKALRMCPSLPLISASLLDSKERHSMTTLTFGDFTVAFCKEIKDRPAFSPFYEGYEALVKDIEKKQMEPQLSGQSCQVRKDSIVKATRQEASSSFVEVLRLLNRAQVIK